MPITSATKRQFRPSKVLKSTWTSFRRGLNTLLRDSELSPEQAKQMQNLVLEGKGIVTQRPGTATLHQASTNGKVRGIFGSKITSVTDLLAITDDGYLTKKNGTSFTRINGASWASGYKVRMAQLQDKVYIVQSQRPLVRYDGTTLISYTTLSSPVSLKATNLSGVTGNFSYSWRVAAVTDVGRTLASDPVVLANLPENLERTVVRISWTAPTGASGLAKAYEIYGRDSGGETRLTSTSPTATTFDDDGASIPSLISGLPDYNETAGPNAKFICKSVGKIVIANIGSKKSRVQWSGADIYAGKFGWMVGGGYCDLDDSDGTEITGIIPFRENTFIVFKERSIYQIRLSYNGDLGIVEPTITKVTDEVGCLSGDTIQPAINNFFFIGLRAGRGISLNSIGYEKNIAADVLRTSEISAVIAPSLESINFSRAEDMFAVVYGGIYWWFFPLGTSAMTAYGYDLERMAIHGPHTFPNNPIIGTVWYDENGLARFVYGDDDGAVQEVSKGYGSDNGVPFSWYFSSKKENFNGPFTLKTLLKAFIHIADIQGGSVAISINTEDDTGNSTTTASFSLDAPAQYAGFGSFKFGTYPHRFGDKSQASTSKTNSSDVRKFVDLNLANIISAQINVSGTGTKAKIIESQLTAREQTSVSSEWQADV